LMAMTAGATSTCLSLAGQDVNPGGNTTSITCTIGPFTFSNFTYSVASSVGAPTTPVITLTSDPNQGQLVGGFWDLVFNPNLGGGTDTDLHLNFTVTGPVDGASLADAGFLSTIQEKNCVGGTLAGDGTGCNGSLATPGTLIWNTAVSDSQSSQCTGATGASSNPAGLSGPPCSYPVPPGFDSSISVWKDINLNQTAGHISAFTEGFQAGVPEPMTFSLMGAGLVGLGLLRRKLKK
jgi:hypothetical protein